MEVIDTLLRSFKGRRMSNAEIARATGLAEEVVGERVRRMYAEQNAPLGPKLADPNELEIMLRASAVRMHWSPAEEMRRRGAVCDWTPPDADMDLCRTIASPPSRW